MGSTAGICRTNPFRALTGGKMSISDGDLRVASPPRDLTKCGRRLVD